MSEHASNLLADAIALAARAHQLQVDKAGEPYILHPLRVMLRVREQGYRVEVQAAAVLHDVVEDTSVTLAEITAISPEVAALVDAVTRRCNITKEIYLDFIRRASSNPEARAIKTADIEDNLSRLDRLRPEETEFLRKRYARGLEILVVDPEDHCWECERRKPPVPPGTGICGVTHETGACQRNAGHGGAHSYVTWPKPGGPKEPTNG
jgi:hypothetical protein